MKYKLPIPQNWQDFESLCLVLWKEFWNDINAQKNGRSGQSQNGIDVFGTPIYSGKFSGVQCKDKDGLLGSVLTKSELKKECQKALKFVPAIDSFTMATTSYRDANLQKYANELSLNTGIPFSVHVWSWNDIEEEIVSRPEIFNDYFPHLHSHNLLSNSITLNRFSSRDISRAYFNRPNNLNLLSQELKEYLMSIAHEYSVNAYGHGNASEFNISIEDNSIVFIDNGKEFNPLENLDGSKASLEGNIGSYLLDKFIKKYSGEIEVSYESFVEDEKTKNSLKFSLLKNSSTIDKREFQEIFVNWKQASDRVSGESLANSIDISETAQELIWSVSEDGYGYALSFLSGFILTLLKRMQPAQKLIVYAPRWDPFDDLKSWDNDERLIIKKK